MRKIMFSFILLLLAIINTSNLILFSVKDNFSNITSENNIQRRTTWRPAITAYIESYYDFHDLTHNS